MYVFYTLCKQKTITYLNIVSIFAERDLGVLVDLGSRSVGHGESQVLNEGSLQPQGGQLLRLLLFG